MLPVEKHIAQNGVHTNVTELDKQKQVSTQTQTAHCADYMHLSLASRSRSSV